MRRRSPDLLEDDSLDLFLDAISNVFGGILFIALAVVVLLQFSVPREPTQATAPRDQPVAVEPAAAPLPDALDDLLSGRPVSDEERSRAAEQRRLRAQRNALVEALGALGRRALAQAAEAQAAEAELSDQQAAVAELERRLLEARQTLRTLERRPAQRVRAARFRPTAKTEVPLMVAADRVVRPIAADGSLDRSALRLNASEQTARPTPGAGQAVPIGLEGDAEIARLLAELDAGRQYLNLAVWPDGFEVARRLRDAAIELGFEFTLTPVPAGSGVPFRAAAGVQ